MSLISNHLLILNKKPKSVTTTIAVQILFGPWKFIQQSNCLLFLDIRGGCISSRLLFSDPLVDVDWSDLWDESFKKFYTPG